MAAKLVILRHGEKPKGKKSALELSSAGKARAQALAANHLGKGARHSLFGKDGPDAFLAITPHTLETASPSAQSWGLPVATYSITGRATPAALAKRTQEAAKRVKRSLARGKTVVMVWEHKHIANARLAPETTLRFLLNLDQLKDVPDNWSDDDYDSLWMVACGRNGTPKHFELRPQHFHPPKAKP
jgi:hypothetical protein